MVRYVFGFVPAGSVFYKQHTLSTPLGSQWQKDKNEGNLDSSELPPGGTNISTYVVIPTAGIMGWEYNI